MTKLKVRRIRNKNTRKGTDMTNWWSRFAPFYSLFGDRYTKPKTPRRTKEAIIKRNRIINRKNK